MDLNEDAIHRIMEHLYDDDLVYSKLIDAWNIAVEEKNPNAMNIRQVINDIEADELRRQSELGLG